MSKTSLTAFIANNLNSLELNVSFLRTYDLTNSADTMKKVKAAIRNVKKRKIYKDRTMGPLLKKIEKDLDRFLTTAVCRNYFSDCALESSITDEENKREVYKSTIRSNFYSQKTRGCKRQKTTNEEDNEEEKVVDQDVESEDLGEAEVSFVTSSTDDSYILFENDFIAADKIPLQKQYYLLSQEIGYDVKISKHSMDNDITFEERIALSSIICKHETPNEMPSLTEFSNDLQVIIREFNKSIAFNTPMNLSSLLTLSPQEQNIACMLLFTSNRVKKKSKQLPCVLSKKFNHGANNELNFIVKQVSLLLESIICSSVLDLDWDITPNCYINCELDVHFNRHDFIIYAENGTEIGTGEVKPYNTPEELVEIDRCRIAESCKKQLHQRLLTARSNKELTTYGIMINGKQVQLSILKLSDEGEYNYYIIYDKFLPTSKETYAFMDETLMIMLQFVKSMENSLLSPEEVCDELILSKFSPFLKPTVYMATDAEPV